MEILLVGNKNDLE